MYYWVCQKCDLKVWGAENCWCGINREQNSALAEKRYKETKGINKMDYIERIKEILSKYKGRDDQFKATVDMLCSNGIGRGVYQDYTILVDVVEILSICETIIKENK